jgi:hypothetical protein
MSCCAKLARIIGVLLVAAALGACSTVRLAYNNLPELSYWWLDGYLDFDSAQTPKVRDELAQLLEWHRRNELPRVAALLQEAQALAPGEVSADQACRMAEQIRERLLAVAVQAEPAIADIALGLGDAQLQQLERKYAKINAEYHKEWLDRSKADVHERRYDRFLERLEDFYGRLEPAQRDLLRRQIAQSVFDPKLADAERRQRQREMLALLRGLQAARPPAAEARAAVHAHVLRIADPPPGPWRAHQQALLEEGCRNLAALHGVTGAGQRDKAVQRLAAYRDDVARLMAAAP